MELTNNELLELASKDVDGVDLLQYIQNKHKDWHPIKCINFVDELLNTRNITN